MFVRVRACVFVCVVHRYTHGLTLSSQYGVATISRLLEITVSLAKEPYKRDYILEKRPMILRSLLIPTPYDQFCHPNVKNSNIRITFNIFTHLISWHAYKWVMSHIQFSHDRCPRPVHSNMITLQHAATRCNTLQHPATPCNTLQHPAT